MKSNKIIVILGQTSTGKSDFAVEVAKQIGGEIISADSRQVYKGMDKGTGKITETEMKGIPHHLLDVANPSRVFTVNQFQKKASKKIAEILKRGKVPIICGGTGFYIDSIVNETVFPNVLPNKKLRLELYKKSAEELTTLLLKLDPRRAENIDQKNKVRLVRAIEIAMALGQVPELNNNLSTAVDTNSPMAEFVSLPHSKYQFLKIGLTLPTEILKERIHIRLLARIKYGMFDEVKKLHSDGLSWKRLNNLGLEYRFVSLYLQGLLEKDLMIEKLNTEIWHFAKRQKTWFKRDPNTLWIDPRVDNEITKVMGKIKVFLK